MDSFDSKLLYFQTKGLIVSQKEPCPVFDVELLSTLVNVMDYQSGKNSVSLVSEDFVFKNCSERGNMLEVSIDCVVGRLSFINIFFHYLLTFVV